MQYWEDEMINAFKMFTIAVVDPKFQTNGNCVMVLFFVFIVHFRPLIEHDKYFLSGCNKSIGPLCQYSIRFATEIKGTFSLRDLVYTNIYYKYIKEM